MNTDEYMGHIAATRKGIETYHGSALGPRGPGVFVVVEGQWVVVERSTLLRESDAGCLVLVTYEAKPRPRLACAMRARVPALAKKAHAFAVMYGEGLVDGEVLITMDRIEAARSGLLDMPTLAEREHLARITA